MGDTGERQPLLGASGRDGDVDNRRESVISFHENDSGNPLEWSTKYKWSSVALLCAFAAVV